MNEDVKNETQNEDETMVEETDVVVESTRWAKFKEKIKDNKAKIIGVAAGAAGYLALSAVAGMVEGKAQQAQLRDSAWIFDPDENYHEIVDTDGNHLGIINYDFTQDLESVSDEPLEIEESDTVEEE